MNATTEAYRQAVHRIFCHLKQAANPDEAWARRIPLSGDGGALVPVGESHALDQDLLATLRTAPPADKAIACKMLSVYGTEACVPELAKLLNDEQLASWARIAPADEG